MGDAKPEVKNAVKAFTKEFVGEVARESTKKLLKRLGKKERAELEAKLKSATREELERFLDSDPRFKSLVEDTYTDVKEASLGHVQARYEAHLAKLVPGFPVLPLAAGIVAIAIFGVAIALFMNGQGAYVGVPAIDDQVEGWTGAASLTFAWDAPQSDRGIAGYYYRVDDAAEQYTTSTKVAVAQLSDGRHVFYARAVDGGNNSGEYGSHDFAIDTTPPNGSIKINNGSSTTTSLAVVLAVEFNDSGSGVAAVRFGNDSGLINASWVSPPANHSYGWSLPALVGTQVSNRTVYYQVRDGVGLVSPVYSAHILYRPAAPPSVIIIAPTGTVVSTGADVRVTFSKAMDKNATESAFSMSPAVKGTFSWDGNTLVFDPASSLGEHTTYTVTITTKARSSDGAYLVAPYSWSFTTPIA